VTGCTHLDQVVVTELPATRSRSAQPGEVWSWCYVDEVELDVARS
jgi:hypothetical protein